MDPSYVEGQPAIHTNIMGEFIFHLTLYRNPHNILFKLTPEELIKQSPVYSQSELAMYSYCQ